MADSQGKGSFLLKIVILILVAAIIIVINVPADIWNQEEYEMTTSRNNMVSVFEAHRYYHKIQGHYTTNISDLISTVQQDTSILKRKKIVDNTVRLKNSIEAYLNVPLVKNLLDISSNIRNTENDFSDNAINFKIFDDFNQESEDLKLELATFRSGVEFENYRVVSNALDSLWQLRRDLTDYSLQNAARRSNALAESISNGLSSIDFRSMEQYWEPLSAKISRFLMKVNNNEELKKKTTIADRVADFLDKVTNGFKNIKGSDLQISYSSAKDGVTDLDRVYQEFLSDFLITERYAQHRLTDTDSMMLYLSENNFFTPTSHQPYIVDLEDSSGIVIEDPTLLKELKDMMLVEVEAINKLPFIEAFAVYEKNLISMHSLSQTIKNEYRRNIDIRIKAKVLDDAITKLRNTGAFDSFRKLKSFIDYVPESQSFSGIKVKLEDALVSTTTFKERYTDMFFGSFDSTHVDVINQLNEYNQILPTVRGSNYSFDSTIENLNLALSQIKSISADAVVPSLENIEEKLQQAFLVGSDGMEKVVYGVFFKRIKNNGKVYGRAGRKSWEDE